MKAALLGRWSARTQDGEEWGRLVKECYTFIKWGVLTPFRNQRAVEGLAEQVTQEVRLVKKCYGSPK